MTVSTPVKIVALAGLAIALGLGGVALLLKGHAKASGGTVTPPPVTHHAASAAPAARVPAPAHAAVKATTQATPKPKPAVKLDPSLPPFIRQALLHHPVAVVAVYSSKDAVDRSVLAEARAGAHTAGAGFAAANVALEAVAAELATWSTADVADPAVLVLERPGRVVFSLTGAVDREMVAQAATR